MTDTLTRRSTHEELRRWNRVIDRLLGAFGDSSRTIPGLAAKLEELKHRRETSSIKARAYLRRCDTGPQRGLEEARAEVDRALEEMRIAWRSVVRTLERDGAFEPPD